MDISTDDTTEMDAQHASEPKMFEFDGAMRDSRYKHGEGTQDRDLDESEGEDSTHSAPDDSSKVAEDDDMADFMEHEVPQEETAVFKMDEDGSDSGAPKLAPDFASRTTSISSTPSDDTALGREMKRMRTMSASTAKQTAEDSEDGSEQDVEDEEDNEYSGAWDADEYPPLALSYQALKHIADHYFQGNHGRCMEITKLTRGTYHEIRVLHFEDGWRCIGRFTRTAEQLEKSESEIATIEYVRQHTSIPVPEIYFVNFNENHAVGAPFVLMELLPGTNLHKLWHHMKTEHKLSAIAQVAKVLARLAGLRFDKIGSLKASTIGPVQNMTYPGSEMALGEGPFDTTQEWFSSFLNESDSSRTEDARALFPAIKTELRSFVAEQQASSEILHAPFRLIHGDFDAQNLLFEQPDPNQPPKLTGVIDWDYSYTGPLYYLCEYPIFIQDEDSIAGKKMWDENKILRQHFVRTLAQSFPKGSSEREDVRECFRQKSVILNSFKGLFMSGRFDSDMEPRLALGYLRDINGEEENEFMKDRAYGRADWEPDSELESDVE